MTQAGGNSKEQGKYTIEDYLAWPEDQRIELIDGYIYEMAAPSVPHQIIAGLLYADILAQITAANGSCVPLISPTDVQLDCDDKTIVEPDVFVVCDRSKIRGKRIFGAPDFVIEVISPATSKKDMTLKAPKYANAGVKEYWMVDPLKRHVIVHVFDDSADTSIYGFDQTVPVAVSNGTCAIDFSRIDSYLNRLFDDGAEE